MLDSYALVLVADFDVVDPNVARPHVDAVKAATVAAVDHHVVDFAITAGVETKVKLRGYKHSMISLGMSRYS